MSQEPPKGTTTLDDAPVVLGKVPVGDSPAATAYRRAMESRKGLAPVAGGPTPPIPRLDSEPTLSEGTLADHARAQRAAAAPARPSIIAAPPRGVPPRAPVAPSLTTRDILPEAAKQDPSYVHAIGSGVAVNQPGLAMKYGVIRDGRHITAAELQGGEPPQKGALRKSTQEGLEALVRANAPGAAAPPPDPPPVLSGLAPQAPPEEERAAPVEAKKPITVLDPYDQDLFRQVFTNDLLNNPEQKALIEGRLAPLDVGALIVNGFVRQRVPIHPGRLEFEFQSTRADDNLQIKRKLFELARGPTSPPEDYLLDLSAAWGIVVGTYALYTESGAHIFPAHRNAQGEWDDKLFDLKAKQILGLPDHLLASLGLNYVWFTFRVRKLFTAEAVKNT